VTEQTRSSSDDDALSTLSDGTLPSDRADALSARLETIMSRLARARAELAELLGERASGGGSHD
jgi:hypothetical protein